MSTLKKLSAISFYFLIFALCLNNSFSYLDPDLGWHLKIGQQIIAKHAVPSQQIYLWTLPNKTWVDHEWLLNAFSYLIFHCFGYIVLSIIFSLAIVLTFYLINLFLWPKTKSHTLIMLIELFGLWGCLPHFGVRMQELTFLFFALLLIWLETGALAQKKFLWLLPLFFYIWASAHAGFLLGLGLLAVYNLVLILINLLAPKINWPWLKNQAQSWPQTIKIAGASLLAATATFITPYGLKLYEFLIGYRDVFYLSHIQEWMPLSALPISYAKLFFLALFCAIVIIIFLQPGKKLLNLWPLTLFGVLVYLSFQSRRHFPLFAVMALLILAPILVNCVWPEIKPDFVWKIKKLKINNKIITMIFGWLLGLSFLAGSVYLLLTAHYTGQPFSAYCQEYPCAAVNFLAAHPELKTKTMFNAYTFGGFMIWAMPDWRLFIDGRLPQYAYNNHSLLAEYFDYQNKSLLPQKLKDNEINLVFLSTAKTYFKVNWFEKHFFGLNETAINDYHNYLQEYLASSTAWQTIYQDKRFIIFEKK